MRTKTVRHKSGLTLAALALTLFAGPAWATGTTTMPGPGAAILAGAAIVGALIVAKLWHRK